MIEQTEGIHKIWHLAKTLHESGRRPVKLGLVYRNELPLKPFAEWSELTDDVKRGRYMMAEFLLDHLPLIWKALP